jgi:hypothetical protein
MRRSLELLIAVAAYTHGSELAMPSPTVDVKEAVAADTASAVVTQPPEIKRQNLGADFIGMYPWPNTRTGPSCK